MKVLADVRRGLMKGHKVPILAIAIGLSCLVHAALYTGAKNVPVHALRTGTGGNGGTLRVGLLGGGQVRDDSAALIQDLATTPAPVDAAPIDPPPPAAEEVPPPPQPLPPEVEKFPDRIGLFDGTGIGSHKADGAQPMKARTADNDQPFLSRDPRGPGRIGDPSPSAVPPGQNGAGGSGGGGVPQEDVVLTPAPQRPIPRFPDAEIGEFRPGPIETRIPTHKDGVATEADKIDESVTLRGPLTPARPGVDPDAQTSGPADGGVAEATGFTKPVRSSLNLPPPPPRQAAMSPPPAPLPLRVPPAVAAPLVPDPPAVVAKVVPNPVPQAGQGADGIPGPPVPAADAAQESESEVDPFSKIEAVVLRDGRVDPQFGREVKTVRPKIPIVGMVDAAMGARRVTLKVRVGADGKVTAVDVFKSSGSNEIDQPCLIAMYEWWFEPLRDKSGRPVPDTVLFTLNFR